jgi:pimeloyl-ACP methyl ester carboxylesterase
MILNYYSKGDPKDPIIVFLHGSASDATVWLNELNIVASRGYYCLAIDLRGHGQTRLMQQPKAHVKIDIDSHVHDVIETLESLEIWPQKKIITVTHSFGGIVAVNLADKFPDLVEKQILVCLPPKLVSPVKDFLQVLLGKPIDIIQQNLDFVRRFILRPRYMSSIMTNAQVLREIYRHVRAWNAFRRMSRSKFKGDIFLAAGRFDLVAPYGLVSRLSDSLANSNFELFKWSGHALMEDEPEKFIQWLLQCISGERNIDLKEILEEDESYAN